MAGHHFPGLLTLQLNLGEQLSSHYAIHSCIQFLVANNDLVAYDDIFCANFSDGHDVDGEVIPRNFVG